MIVCDTGPIVAAAIGNDIDNRACTDLLTGLHLAKRLILVPGPVVAEVGYLLGRSGSPQIEAGFLRSIADGSLTAVNLAPRTMPSGSAADVRSGCPCSRYRGDR